MAAYFYVVVFVWRHGFIEHSAKVVQFLYFFFFFLANVKKIKIRLFWLILFFCVVCCKTCPYAFFSLLLYSKRIMTTKKKATTTTPRIRKRPRKKTVFEKTDVTRVGFFALRFTIYLSSSCTLFRHICVCRYFTCCFVWSNVILLFILALCTWVRKCIVSLFFSFVIISSFLFWCYIFCCEDLSCI